MRALLARNVRTVFGMILAIGLFALPQASWAQAQRVSGRPDGIKMLALPGGNGYTSASLAGWNLQRLHVWFRLLEVAVTSGSVSAPPASGFRKLQIVDEFRVQSGNVNLR